MKLRIKAEERWVTVHKSEGSEEKAEFLLICLSPRDNFDLVQENTKKEWENGQRFETADLYAFKIGKICKTIKDWKGIEAPDGSPLPCTDEWKKIVYLYNPEFINKVLDEAEKLSQDVAGKTEAEIKN
jgi:hypothetical protein